MNTDHPIEKALGILAAAFGGYCVRTGRWALFLAVLAVALFICGGATLYLKLTDGDEP